MEVTGLPGLMSPWENQLLPAEGPKENPGAGRAGGADRAFEQG